MANKRRRGNGQGTLFKRAQSGDGPWIAKWYDQDGKRRQKSTGTTDKAAAKRILQKRVEEVALRKAGVLDARQESLSAEMRKPLSSHIDAYMTHCDHSGQASRTMSQKRSHLDQFVRNVRASRLADLTPECLEGHLRFIHDQGKASRTVNHARQDIVAFGNWCVQTGRLERNMLAIVSRLDEQNDRRLVRRSLTPSEVTNLIEVARERGRAAWYLLCLLAGFRRGDLTRLLWRDIDFEARTITIREGKSKRIDQLPLHPQLAEELQRLKEASLPTPMAKVFTTDVTNETRKKDFKRAGIALRDEEGQVADLHSLRTTLGTNLARAGVVPQVAQKIMRHADYKTTQRHYTVLGLNDTAKALEMIRVEPAATAQHATGTDSGRVTSSGTSSSASPGIQMHPESVSSDDRNHPPEPRNHLIHQPKEQARDLNQSRAWKRAKGLEPSTFSLEG